MPKLNVEGLHSIAVAVLSAFAITVCLLGPRIPESTIRLIGLVGVLLIGLPHGGMDHRVGERLFARFGLPHPMIVFLTSYLVLGLIVIAAWFATPVVAILTFFLLSAWHFGLEEQSSKPESRLEFFSMLSRGGLVIWVPCLFQSERVHELLQATVPKEFAGDVWFVVELVKVFWPLWFAGLLIDLWLYRFGKGKWRRDRFTLQSFWPDGARVICFGGLFAITDPLVSFVVYFCGWHSIRGLAELKRQFECSVASIAWQIVPITLTAIGLFLAGWWFWSHQIGWSDAAVRTTFIGLSAVAIPHLTLHLVAKLCLDRVQPLDSAIGRGASPCQ